MRRCNHEDSSALLAALLIVVEFEDLATAITDVTSSLGWGHRVSDPTEIDSNKTFHVCGTGSGGTEGRWHLITFPSLL